MLAKHPSFLQLPADVHELTAEDKRRSREEIARGMVEPQDPVLDKVAAAIAPNKLSTPRIQSMVTQLIRIASDQRQVPQKSKKRRRMLVGLAGPQIGQSYRIMVIDTKIRADRKKPGTLECFINPEIVWRSRETAEGREGCFSAGPVWGLVRRPVAVKIRALTPEGLKTERIFEGFTARIACHEIDHLDGIRFPERIKSDRKRHWVNTEELDLYPLHIQHWPRYCDLERWERFKTRP